MHCCRLPPRIHNLQKLSSPRHGRRDGQRWRCELPWQWHVWTAYQDPRSLYRPLVFLVQVILLRISFYICELCELNLVLPEMALMGLVRRLPAFPVFQQPALLSPGLQNLALAPPSSIFAFPTSRSYMKNFEVGLAWIKVLFHSANTCRRRILDIGRCQDGAIKTVVISRADSTTLIG